WDAMAAMGTERLTPGESVDALSEAIDVIRGVWSASERGSLTLPGEHHRVAGAARGPAPAHTVPIWLGALKPRMLRLIGAKADGWLPSLGRLQPEDLRAGNGVIDEAAETAGRDPREIRRLLNVGGSFQDAPGGLLVGPAEQWAEQLTELALEDGVGTFILASDDPDAWRRFAGAALPAVREAVAAARAARHVAEGEAVSLRVRALRREGIDYAAIPDPLADAAIEPGDPRYAAVHSTYMRGGSPGLVLQPRTTAEVVDALAYARAQPVPLAVRSAGHGISGRSTNDGGVVIDLSRMNRIEVVDPATRLVRVEPGARWGEVAAALHPYGWAISSGDYGGVGVGGLATAGGIGFLAREHGLTIDHVRAVEMVLADGAVVRADATENRDLFWAVRGAGANFGIVTSFELEADEVGDVGFAQLAYDASDTADFLERWGAVVEAAPRDVTSFLMMGAPRGGQVTAQVMTMVDSDDPDVVLERLQPFARLGPLLDQAVQILPYAAVVSTPEEKNVGRGEPVSRSALAEHITPGLARAVADFVRGGNTYFFQIRAAGGAVADVAPDATAYAHRSANFSVTAFGSSRSRLDQAWDAMAEHYSGLYLSFDTDLRPERLLDAYPPSALARLRALKRRYDPDNVFRDNFNISPDV
ncbi:MAG: LLM class flavin-dependent oxidoreductase, partial [Cellulomonadaceae bacterium]